MDPASAIIGIASGAVGLVAITAQVVASLAGFKDAHRNVRVLALDLSSTCRAYEAAWTRIHDWARTIDGSGSAASAESHIEDLRNLLDDGETIVRWIQDDLNRLSSSPQLSWWRSNAILTRKETALLVIHEKNVREHIGRLSRQNINLNVIISTMNLCGLPQQEAALSILRPKFRKDEETAWTIVNSKMSRPSKLWPSIIAASNRLSAISMTTITRNPAQAGDKTLASEIEDDLFLGPVYRRLLIKKLCEGPSEEAHSAKQSAPTQLIPGTTTPSSDRRPEHAAVEQARGFLPTLPSTFRRKCPSMFSLDCHDDLRDFCLQERPRNLARRHLPFASIDARQQLTDYHRGRMDKRFFDAAVQGHLPEVAQALQLGADINFRADTAVGDSKTALEVCVLQWMKHIANEPEFMSTGNHVTEFLLLYEETYISLSFDGTCTILHLCMAIGATTDFMRPFCGWSQDAEELQICNAFDKTVTSVATCCSLIGRVALMRLRLAYAENHQLDTFLSIRYGLVYDSVLDCFRVYDCRRFRLREEAEHRSMSGSFGERNVSINGHYGGGHTCGCQLCEKPTDSGFCRHTSWPHPPYCLVLVDPLLCERRPSVEQIWFPGVPDHAPLPQPSTVVHAMSTIDDSAVMMYDDNSAVASDTRELTQLDTSHFLDRSGSCNNEQAEPQSLPMTKPSESWRNTVG